LMYFVLISAAECTKKHTASDSEPYLTSVCSEEPDLLPKLERRWRWRWRWRGRVRLSYFSVCWQVTVNFEVCN
jgi:hypothetical protein